MSNAVVQYGSNMSVDQARRSLEWQVETSAQSSSEQLSQILTQRQLGVAAPAWSIDRKTLSKVYASDYNPNDLKPSWLDVRPWQSKSSGKLD